MTDITELAPAMKAAAEKATPGPWIVVDHFWLAPESEAFSGEFVECHNGPDAQYLKLLSPENILALVEALEKAQQERENWRTSFDNERFRADKLAAVLNDEIEQAANVRGQLLIAHKTLLNQQAKIAELEFIRTSADKVQREFADELGCAGDNESILQAIEDLKVQSNTALELKQAALADNAHLKLELGILESSHKKLREGMAAIYNAICAGGASTSVSAILTFVKRAHAESAAAGIKVEGE